MNFEELLTVGALLRWCRGEPISKEDLLRILAVFEKPLRISESVPQEIAAMRVRLQNVLRAQFFGNQAP